MVYKKSGYVREIDDTLRTSAYELPRDVVLDPNNVDETLLGHSDLAAEAKTLAYRLYQICERKGWADIALDYNALVQSWPGLQERAAELKQNQPPEQLGLL